MKTSNQNSIYLVGAISTILVLVGISIDFYAGSANAGNLNALPQTAVDRFMQFKENRLLGLYNLDLLNTINQIILIPAYLALFVAHRKTNFAYAALALIIFLVGTAIFVSNNTALPMLNLSDKFFAATDESQKMLLAAAGESMLARGAHGTPGVFISFLLPTVAGIIMSLVMLHGRIFSKATAYFGLIGSVVMIGYFFLVTFVPDAEKMATVYAAPGGICSMVWMILFTIRLFKLYKGKEL